jgi:Carboxypeptidase regulatory-like domain
MLNKWWPAAGLIMAASLLLPSLALAQANSVIAGVVKDTSGAVLPGVTVEASSPALIERSRSVVTDGEGQYKIISLRPGVYAVSFSLSGFSTVKREGIELTASFTATVNADLRVGSLTETVTVSGAAPTVDVQNVVQQKVMTRDVVDAIPVGAKSVMSVGVLIPGVTTNSQDVGGTQYGSAALAIHGSVLFEQQLLYDGVLYNNGAGRGGSFTAIAPNSATIQEISYETGGLSAESELAGIRTNIIPKDGGNQFAGFFFGAFTNHDLQSNNLTSDLVLRGLTSVDRVNYIYDIDPAAGGPIAKDKLWFYTSVRQWKTDTFAAGLYYNQSPVPYAYVPNLSQPAYEGDRDQNASLRLTWQLSDKNKVNIQDQWADQLRDHFYSQSTTNRTQVPTATIYYHGQPSYLSQATWNSPVTSRLLLEAGAGFANKDFQYFLQSGDGVTPSTPAFSDLGTGYSWGSLGSPYGHNATHNFNARFTTSYVTGSHAAKVGLTFQHDSAYTTENVTNNGVTYQLRNGVPTQITEYATPLALYEVTKANIGVFGQDQWTFKRLTVNMGLRFDYLNSYVPAETNGPGPLVPGRNAIFPEVDDAPDWRNVSPRLGGAFDLFGNGKTALKASIGRYLEGPNLTSFTRLANPAANIALNATRSWTDSNGDFVPECNFTIVAANGECGKLSNVNFGNSIPTTTYAPDALTTRGYNWEFQTGIQHELFPQVSVAATYARRWYGNLRVTQNTAVSTASFSPFCITAPVNSGLPGGGGYQECGLYDVNPAQFGLVNNVISVAPQLQQVYDGVDLTLSARLPRRLVVSGGVSTGRQRTNDCSENGDLSLAFPASTGSTSVVAPRTSAFCDVRPPFQPNVKFLVVYPLPWAGIQTAATIQSLPGPQISATYAVTSALVATSLGRNLSAGTATVDLVAPGTMYGDRLNQLDFRLSKIFRFGTKGRIQGNVDLYNVFNSSPVLALNNTYGSAWERPLQILQGRLLKFSAQLDF